MKFDYYADLADMPTLKTCLKSSADLVSGFADECIVFSERGDDEKNKIEVRDYYRKQAKLLSKLELPEDIKLDQCLSFLPNESWIGFEIDFILQRSWYSKDDKPLHIFDNPLLKDRIFGVPYMSATSWKGLLRWACRMQSGLLKHLESHDCRMDGWRDDSWIVHLFGNDKNEKKEFLRGALVFYPTWFKKIDFELINPHDRAKRAGTTPIYYEVVPANTNGTLNLLYAPLPGAAERIDVEPVKALCYLLEAIESLLTSYGISAKRTGGWGTAKIEGWKAFMRDQHPIEERSISDFKESIQSLLTNEGWRL